MAKVKLNLFNTRGLQDHSVYQMTGCKHLIIRKKGGASKNIIKESPNFATVRMNNEEFTAASKASARLKQAMFPIKHLTKVSASGQITAFCLRILKMDQTNNMGERSVLFSHYPGILTGFNVNKEIAFDSIFNNQVSCILNRKEGSVIISIPNLIPNMNLTIPWDYPLYRLIMSIGIVPNIIKQNNIYDAQSPEIKYFPESIITNWQNSKQMRNEESFVLQSPPGTLIDPSCSLIVSVGIEMGVFISETMMKAIPGIGAAKILVHG